MGRQHYDLTNGSAVSIFGLGIAVGTICTAGFGILYPSDQSALEPPMAYTDIAVLVLTCVTIIITCAALVIGVLGIWGFQRIKEDAVESAVKRALDRVEEEMKDGGALSILLLAKFAEYENRMSGATGNVIGWGNENSEHGE